MQSTRRPKLDLMNIGSSQGENLHRRILGDLLLLFRRELSSTLRPEITSPYAQYVADVMCSMLSFIEDWTVGTPYSDVDAWRAELAARFGRPGEPDSRLVAFDDGSGVDATLARTVVAAAERGAPDLDLLFAQIGALHDSLYTEQTRRHQERRARDQSRMAQVEIELTIERFDRFARERLGIIDDATQRITKIPGGNSKDTFLVRLRSGRELIVRRDFPFGPTETSAPQEFGPLSKLRSSGMPVPRPLFAEFDREYLGQPAIVVEKIEGENALAAATRDKPTGRLVSFELARLLARLHDIDPKALGLEIEAGTPQNQVRAYVARWRRWWDINRLHSSSLVEAGFAWLDRHVPADVDKIVPIHGDARPDNMMFLDGAVSGLLDWEFLHAGDTSEDLQYAKGFVEPFVSWDEFLAAYEAAGGSPVTEASSKFYDVFRSLRNVVCVDVSWSGFVSGKYPSFKLASQGVFYRQMLAHALAKSLKA